MIKDKVIYVVYHDLSTEARSFEMLCALKDAFEDVTCVCRKPPIDTVGCKMIYPKSIKNQYVEFYKLAKKTIHSIEPQVLVLHDEFTAPFISLGKRLNSFIIFDSSELNYKRVLPGLKNKLAKYFYYIERKNLKQADLVFAANIERLEIMKKEYNLSCQLEVFDNIHRIDDSYDDEECKKKYGKFFSEYKYPLVYGGGISHSRFTFKLVEAFANTKDLCLLIIGSTSETCRKEFNELLATMNINNVYYLGFIPRAEFKYLLENAFASFVLFKSDCPNTVNCASGKMYESLFLGTPIICSDNPPLKRICSKYMVGESSMDFQASFQKILENRSMYVEKIREYVNSIDYDNRIIKLSNTIVDAYTKSIQ
ncbi:MAG: hypothetical protein IJ819_04635 [Clostridiales bacterium]|nr:hypothetical protein [Clostridiales bacterium]